MPNTSWRRADDPATEWWIEAFALASMAKAGKAYERVSAVLRAAGNVDASVYRVQVNGQPMLVMLGRSQPGWEVYYLEMRLACAVVEKTRIPVEVELALLERSARAWALEPGFIERRNINEVVE